MVVLNVNCLDCCIELSDIGRSGCVTFTNKYKKIRAAEFLYVFIGIINDAWWMMFDKNLNVFWAFCQAI